MDYKAARAKRGVKIKRVARLKKRIIKFRTYLDSIIKDIEEIEKGKEPLVPKSEVNER